MTMRLPLFTIPVLLVILVAYVVLSPAITKLTIDSGLASSHALAKHGEDAVLAQQCKSSSFAYRFYNPVTDRTGLACEVDGKWAVVILDNAGREITSFVKNKLKSFDQVVKYMKNAGYNLP
jgi:hypothetical protein